MNAVSLVLTAISLLLLAWGAMSWAARRPAFEFQEIVITAPPTRVNAAHLEAVIRDEFKGTFFTMNLDRARTALARVPWVRRVALRRQWPHRLEVIIEEHVPLARWNDAALVNGQGEVFVANCKDPLPRFVGPDGAAQEVTRRYREWGAQLAALSLGIDAMRLSPRGGWYLHVANGNGPLGIELGRDDPAGALARFVAVYERTIGALARAGTKVEQVDLRYRNGFAAKVPGFRERAPRKVA
ncbi:MAG: cell division protein FtsQ/DivIB [Casimicrobiaceae bacterium]